ncbi:unnamed protein product, partial [Sphagnum balticum]
MNNNLLTERALNGVFNTTSYITFGTTDDPLPYPHKDVPRSNFTGKQMQSHTPKLGFQTNDVFFQKEHPWVFDGDLYIDKNMYLTSQPQRFKGFLSSDFSKTDEFSNVCRTEQYRSQLKASAQYCFAKGLVIFFCFSHFWQFKPSQINSLSYSLFSNFRQTFAYKIKVDLDCPNFKSFISPKHNLYMECTSI